MLGAERYHRPYQSPVVSAQSEIQTAHVQFEIGKCAI